MAMSFSTFGQMSYKDILSEIVTSADSTYVTNYGEGNIWTNFFRKGKRMADISQQDQGVITFSADDRRHLEDPTLTDYDYVRFIVFKDAIYADFQSYKPVIGEKIFLITYSNDIRKEVIKKLKKEGRPFIDARTLPKGSIEKTTVKVVEFRVISGPTESENSFINGNYKVEITLLEFPMTKE